MLRNNRIYFKECFETNPSLAVIKTSPSLNLNLLQKFKISQMVLIISIKY